MRKRSRLNPLPKQRKWKFFVYQLMDGDEVAYIGKGSGNRLAGSKWERKVPGYEVARFKRECDAYDYEVERIAEYKPKLNKNAGGLGNWTDRRSESKKLFDKALLWVNRHGSHRAAAILLLQYAHKLRPVTAHEVCKWGAIAIG